MHVKASCLTNTEGQKKVEFKKNQKKTGTYVF